MMKTQSGDHGVRVIPATAECWRDLEALFGKNGASAGCWCMFWRLKRADFKTLKGEGTRAELRAMTMNNAVPGVLAYLDGKAIGWCSIGPREDFAALEDSHLLKRMDDRPVWSIVCFYVARGHRRQGVAQLLLKGAAAYAISKGAKIIEAYPIDMQSPQLQGKRLDHCGGYMGIASIFRTAGFQEVSRASETQLIMRYNAS